MKTRHLTALTLISLTALTGCSATQETLDALDAAASATPATAEPTTESPAPATTTEPAAPVAPAEQPVTGLTNPATALIPSTTPATPATAEEITTAKQLAATLTIAHQDSSGYKRTEHFGEAWLDVDNNGCDTRNDILARDLTNTTTDTRCRVTTGTLQDPYTGTTITFKRGQGTSDKVQIDHIIALNEAWGSGASQWSQEQRIAFANDPANLIAADGPSNTAKGAKDAAKWAVPDNPAFTCTYLTRQIILKNHYQLTVDKAEYDALNQGITNC